MNELRRTNRTVGTLGVLSIASTSLAMLGGAGCPGFDFLNPGASLFDTTTHGIIFTEVLADGYQGTDSCLTCHYQDGQELIASAHWNWSGTSARIEGHETEIHGKIDLINNL
ncbi:MAG: hypothetical protein JXQ75_17205 [Phycisphaerae bacterium]|nr:hypothetical protein [Phycisphaerae bacterium]